MKVRFGLLSMNLKTLGLISKDLQISGSRSQCMRKSERGLSLNRRTRRQVLARVVWRFGKGGVPSKSATGLAHSTTLPRGPQVHGSNARHQSREVFP
jgi:hypothetical protein